MKKLLWIVIFVLTLIFIMSGCSNSTAPTITPGQSLATAQQNFTTLPATQTSAAAQQISSTSPSASRTATENIKGDVNQDGVVDMGDTLTVENMILGTIPQDKRGDVNGDGLINMGDISALEQIMLGTH
jgi:PBP1b-binding outer membrane lipoprotein LpoB